jgi:hypothetical protein
MDRDLIHVRNPWLDLVLLAGAIALLAGLYLLFS